MTSHARFPQSLLFVIIDVLERAYLYGFVLLQLFVTLFPLVVSSKKSTPCTGDHCADPESEGSAMEFLPLMLTSVYCAVGLVWAFLRLSVLYLRQ